MRISIGAGHAGYEMKKRLAEFMQKLGHVVNDEGTHEPGKPERDVLVCGSGVGVSVAANKFKGIRAGALS
jgi:ribose 5-phosphate isomerase B